MRIKTYHGFALGLAAAALFAASTAQLAHADIIVQPTDVSASSTKNDVGASRLPAYTIDGSGLSDASVVDTGDAVPATYPSYDNNVANNDSWLATTNTGTITFDLGDEYNLTGFHVWNVNLNTAGQMNRGAKDVNVSFSTTSMTGGFSGATAFTFAEASGLNTYTGEDFSLTSPTSARYVKFNITSNYGSSYVGLSEVRFTATVPEPASGALALLGLGALLMLPPRKRRRRSEVV